MLGWLARAFERRRARRCALVLARRLRPDERVHAAVVVEIDTRRSVVRVFVGERVSGEAALLPPWHDCLIIAVPSGHDAPYLVEDDARYRPTLR